MGTDFPFLLVSRQGPNPISFVQLDTLGFHAASEFFSPTGSWHATRTLADPRREA